MAMDKTTYGNLNPVSIYHFIASISNTTIAENIAKLIWDSPGTLQDVFKNALALEATYSWLKMSI